MDVLGSWSLNYENYEVLIREVPLQYYPSSQLPIFTIVHATYRHLILSAPKQQMQTCQAHPKYQEVLQTPKPKRKAGTKRSRTLNMPKHMTGEEFIELMEQKKREKKKQRKEDKLREKERQRIKEEKAKAIQERKMMRQKKKAATQQRKKTPMPISVSECCAECGSLRTQMYQKIGSHAIRAEGGGMCSVQILQT